MLESFRSAGECRRRENTLECRISTDHVSISKQLSTETSSDLASIWLNPLFLSLLSWLTSGLLTFEWMIFYRIDNSQYFWQYQGATDRHKPRYSWANANHKVILFIEIFTVCQALDKGLWRFYLIYSCQQSSKGRVSVILILLTRKLSSGNLPKAVIQTQTEVLSVCMSLGQPPPWGLTWLCGTIGSAMLCHQLLSHLSISS